MNNLKPCGRRWADFERRFPGELAHQFGEIGKEFEAVIAQLTSDTVLEQLAKQLTPQVRKDVRRRERAKLREEVRAEIELEISTQEKVIPFRHGQTPDREDVWHWDAVTRSLKRGHLPR
jgi:tRNA U34 5-methylaminomethyl-2-thiouridine-forming methyltransferase MnmC